MGSIITAIRDDYEDYIFLCKDLNIIPLSDRCVEPTFYEHREEILKSVNCSSIYEYIKNLNKK